MHIPLPSLNLADTERRLILVALAEFPAQSSWATVAPEAAKMLGLTRHALDRRMKRHALEWPPPLSPAHRVLGESASVTLSSCNLNAAERQLLEQALAATGLIHGAAKLLGITRHAVKRRIIKHGIKFRPSHPAYAPAQIGDQ